MLKKLFWVLLMLVASMGLALADVEINSGDQAALDGIKGVGPAMSKKIIEERTAHGPFKDWADFQKRVKGVGDKNSAKLSQAGLRVNGQAKDGAASAAAPAASVKPASAAAPAASVKPASAAAPAASVTSASAASKAASGK